MDAGVVAAMLPWMTRQFGNPHSHTHEIGRLAARACDDAIASVAAILQTSPDHVIVTSGATESNNLAIDGFMRHPRQKRRRIITSATEHPAVLDPVMRLKKDGFDVTVMDVRPQGDQRCGQIDLQRLRETIDDNTALVSIMWANNEIGTVSPMAEMAQIVHAAGAMLHCDATQVAGQIPIDMVDTDIDLLSLSAHKFYGPMGIGLLALHPQKRIRLKPMFEGGGQQQGLRSGTVNVPGLIGMSEALRFVSVDSDRENDRLRALRDRLWQRLETAFPGIELNGPPLADVEREQIRLVNNLNISLAEIEGETIMAAAPELAISSGSACSSVDPRPSHVLMAIGLSESRARRSLRFGLGRSTTAEDIDDALEMLVAAAKKIDASAML